MPPRPVTSASRRGKRIIASPAPSASADGSEGEEKLNMDLESEGEVSFKHKGKEKAHVVPPKHQQGKAFKASDMDIDEDVDGAMSEDELDVIGEYESEEDEEVLGDKEEDDEEYEDEEEDGMAIQSPRTDASSSRRPGSVATPLPPPRASRAVAPTATPIATPSISASGSKTGLRIRLNVTRPSPLGRGAVGAAEVEQLSGKRPARAAAKKAGSKNRAVAMEDDLDPEQDPDSSDEDELDEEDELEDDPDAEGEELDVDMDLDPIDHDRRSEGQSSRAVSPTKLTARQRAKGNADLQGVLIALPSEGSGAKKLVLTEAERVERREEMARRRKRQTDQKKQDEQDETINRLLRAQTSRSRNKIEAPDTGSGNVTPGPDGSGLVANGEEVHRARGRHGAMKDGMIRWVSTVVPPTAGGERMVICRLGVPKDLMQGTEILNIAGTGASVRRNDDGGCAVTGCKNGRKYRSTRKFEVGGCSLEHLRLVNENLELIQS